MSEKEVCQKCGSSLIVQLGTQKHCNACGHDFGVSKNPVADAVQKRKLQGVVGWRRPDTNET